MATSTRSVPQSGAAWLSQPAVEELAAHALSSAAAVANRVRRMVSSWVGDADTNAGQGGAGLNSGMLKEGKR